MKHLLLAMTTAVALAACATGPSLSDSQKLDLYRAHAGAPVDSFRYTRSLNGWSPVGDGALAIRTRPDEGYLLVLSGACPGLEYAQAIHITNQLGRVHAGFDDVIVLDSTLHDFPCRIDQIRPLDVEALEQAEEDLREEIEMVERTQSAAEGSDDGAM